MRKTVKKKEGENLTASNIENVIGLLRAEKPITKTEACKILNISYNTKRLDKIIEEFEEEKAYVSQRKKQNRGKPATEHEIQSVIESYLDGQPFSEIAERIYRSTAFVKNIVEDVGVPSKPDGFWDMENSILPEKCQAEKFEINEVVWSARSGKMAIVRSYLPANDQRDYDCYGIYEIEAIENESPYFPQYRDYGGRHATAAVYDIGSLKHLTEHGVDVARPYRNTFKNWLS